MGISAIRAIDRRRVAWYGGFPAEDVAAAFLERQFLVDECSDTTLQDPIFMAGLAAVVFTQKIEKPVQVVRTLANHARRLLDYDCRIVIRPASDRLSDEIVLKNHLGQLALPIIGLRDSLTGDPPLPHLRFCRLNIPWTQIADFLLMYPPGAPPSSTLEIDSTAIKSRLSPSREILLRRAFYDCSRIHLVRLEDGRSAGVEVYRAHAELARGLEGQWPQPFFIKIGKRKKIYSEYENYQGRVDPYVPFHLGPHLVSERCCLGAYEGVIVGDYVDGSECLTNCACEGRASSAIACLFDKTLAGWHRRGREERNRSIAELLARLFPSHIAAARYAQARVLGATLTLSQLRRLFDRCRSTPVVVGPVHGDLHAKNVRVRGADAIVIDFLSHRQSPLLSDAASLEASLLVDGFGSDPRTAAEWMDSIRQLYDGSPLKGATPHGNPHDPSNWFYSCIGQVRRYARQWECHETQYAGALGAALLRKAMKDVYATQPKSSRHAAAYVFAERILSAAFGHATD